MRTLVDMGSGLFRVENTTVGVSSAQEAV